MARSELQARVPPIMRLHVIINIKQSDSNSSTACECSAAPGVRCTAMCCLCCGLQKQQQHHEIPAVLYNTEYNIVGLFAGCTAHLYTEKWYITYIAGI